MHKIHYFETTQDFENSYYGAASGESVNVLIYSYQQDDKYAYIGIDQETGRHQWQNSYETIETDSATPDCENGFTLWWSDGSTWQNYEVPVGEFRMGVIEPPRGASNYNMPWLSCVAGNKKPKYNKSTSGTPFTIEALGTGEITWQLGDYKLSYSKNGSAWQEMSSNTMISVVNGDEVAFIGEEGTFSDEESHKLSCTANFNVKGNILSLTGRRLYKYCFGSLFNYNDTLISAEHLQLPSKRLKESCYSSMFYGCTNLITAPALPATTLAYYCYENMFSGCTGLITAPALPATTLASNCYDGMFYRCTGLITAPALPATTLASNCYNGMFSGCSRLITAPVLPATTLTGSCYAFMFNGCTSLITAPELPATTLVTYCYEYMFRGCTKLNYIKAMFTTTPSSSYTSSWVNNVAATGTFVKNSAAQWDVTGDNGIPSGWTVQTATE